jgi:hypothetical protein
MKREQVPVSETGHFGPFLSSALAGDVHFARFVERWRAEDRRDRRATAPFSTFPTIAAMTAEVGAPRPNEQAWKRPARERDYPTEALRSHARSAEHWAARCCTTPDELIAWMRGTSPTFSIPGPVASTTMIGRGASSAAAHVYNDDRGRPADTRLKGFNRLVDREPDGTTYELDPVPVIVTPRTLSGLDG